MNIYLDVCCLNRPFDDQSQDRIYLEAEAVLTILARCQSGKWTLAGSDVIELELSKLPDPDKLAKVRAVYSLHGLRLTINDKVKARSEELLRLGLKLFDSLHLALAEIYRQDVLLSTDDGFIKAATRFETKIPVKNPVSWLMEEMRNEH